jgi:IclR family acetate operon transcriptional repressor
MSLMERSHPPRTMITSVQRAMRLMEATANHGSGAPVKLLAREAGLRLGTAYHLVRTLAYEGYLQRLGGGLYVLGDRLDRLVGQGRLESISARARPGLTALRDQAQAASYLCLYDDGEFVLSDVVDSPLTPRIELWVGLEWAGHATALGKCILAQLDQPSQREYLARHPLGKLTSRTITGEESLLRSLPAPGQNQVTIDREEYSLGTVCIAGPVRDDRSVLGSIAISVPSRRLDDVKTLSPIVLKHAAGISAALALSS